MTPVSSDPTARSPSSPRSLEVDGEERHSVRTPDGVELLLTRYQGGEKGPVVLSHCIGVSSRMYSTTLVSQNLLEYLYDHGYDVWLLDFRFSIDLPSAEEQHSMDAVAQQDYPAAVDAVRDLASVGSVQVVAHGVGASTLTMSLLRGLEGVRSAVFSQVSTHVLVAPLAQLAARLRANQGLEWLGHRFVSPDVPTDPGLRDRLVSWLLNFYPLEDEEQCDNPVCHRITGIYGLMWEHDRIDPAVHDHLSSLFGPANLEGLSQLSRIARRRHLVNRQGEDVYLPHLNRLALPAAYLHGSENMCVLPRSTALTYKRLRRTNDPDLYRRHVIPGYGHIDCMLGTNAPRDVYPLIREHLDATARSEATSSA